MLNKNIVKQEKQWGGYVLALFLLEFWLVFYIGLVNMLRQYEIIVAQSMGKKPFKLTDLMGNIRYTIGKSYKQCRAKFTENWKVEEVSWEEYYKNSEIEYNIDAQMKNPTNE